MDTSAYAQYRDYVNGLFSADDSIFIQLIHSIRTHKDERNYDVKDTKLLPLTKRDQLNTEKAFARLLEFEGEGWNVYVCMNPFPAGTTRRLEAFVRKINNLFIESDNHKDTLALIRNDAQQGLIPEPSSILQSSLGKYHIVWCVEGFKPETAKPLLKAMAERYGGDPQATDLHRVLRMPGFHNLKYEDKPATQWMTSRFADGPNKPEDFTIPYDVPKLRKAPAITSESLAKIIDIFKANAEKAECILGLEHEHAGGVKWIIPCPWASKHTTPGDTAALFVMSNGALEFNCFHAHCAERGWSDIRKIWEAFAGPMSFTEEERINRDLPVNRTEVGNAIRFATAYADTTRYSFENKTWFVWDGKRWEESDGSHVTNGMKAIAKTILEEARGIADKKTRETHRHWGLRSESCGTISSSLKLAQSEEGIPIDFENLDDGNTDLKFNAGNFTLDVGNNTFYEHKKTDYITKLGNVVYDAKATCPRFLAFLEDVLPDPDVRAYIQRAAGLSLTGFTGEHALFLLYGTGRNGKSTLVDTLRYVLGDYATQSDWSSFTESNYGSRGSANNDIARLRGARFVVASESKEDAKLAEGVIKNITGGEAVPARFLFKEFFEYKPKFKLWLTTNHKPKIVGTDPAIWSRVNLINFGVQIPAEKRDKDLPMKLREEASGILNWMLEGFRLWSEIGGLNPPSAVQIATEEYRKESDTFQRFLDEKMEIGKDFVISASDAYNAYKFWAEDSAEHSRLTSQQFYDNMVRRGFVYHRTNVLRQWHGLQIAQGVLSQPSSSNRPTAYVGSSLPAPNDECLSF
jgi:putative DNA primase/helicase